MTQTLIDLHSEEGDFSEIAEDRRDVDAEVSYDITSFATMYIHSCPAHMAEATAYARIGRVWGDLRHLFFLSYMGIHNSFRSHIAFSDGVLGFGLGFFAT